MYDLFEKTICGGRIMIQVNNQNIVGNEKEIIIERFGRNELLGCCSNLSMSEVQIKENTITKKHYHTTFDEFYYVNEGEGIFVVDEKEYVFQQGDCIFIQKEEEHHIITKDKEAKFIVICTPAWNEKDMQYK